MSRIEIHLEKCADKAAVRAVCPFGAIEEDAAGRLFAGAGCKMCRVCTRRDPAVFEFVEDAAAPSVDKSKWRGIAVVAELSPDGAMHPVALELLGKARELAAEVSHPVLAVVCGADCSAAAETLLAYGADEVHVYEHPELRHFRIEPHAAALEDFIERAKPSSVLVGGTPCGRSLAPRLAARFHTGLTADCTSLGIQENTDLDQIRPAYGGNIMAHINTPRTRPQFATVRYKVFAIPERVETRGRIVRHELPSQRLVSAIEILECRPKPPSRGIEDAEAIVVCGRGVRRQEDVEILRSLADALGAQLASTRAVVDAGWIEPARQIGLSGRTVKPKLIVTCGVSGAIQFVSGMSGAGMIVAINSDPEAPIFQIAHVGLVGDLYEIVPEITARVRAKKEAAR